MKTPTAITACIGLLVTAATATATAAEGVPIKPGLWKTTSTMTLSMMPQPRIKTTTRCIKKDTLGPEEFDMDKDSPCKFSDFVTQGDTTTWSVNCPFEGAGVLTGSWKFYSRGDSISGNGSMSADMNGMKMGMTMAWQGQRLGACD